MSKHLRPHIDTDGRRNSAAEVAWDSYCFELGGIFPDRLPDSESVTPFFQNLSRDYGCLGPIITMSYIEDLSMLWTEVHPALLEVKLKLLFAGSSLILPVQVTRWLEPFIDYGPDYDRATPLHSATITLMHHARELFIWREGVKESSDVFYNVGQQRECIPKPYSPSSQMCGPGMRYSKLMRVLCEHQSRELMKMQREMQSVMSSAVSRNFEPAANAAEVAALVVRAKQAMLWRVTGPSEAQMQDARAGAARDPA